MSTISDIELSQLRLLQLIFETRNLTRAGERAGLTQSAVSHVLKKLRLRFDDSLVIRQGNSLVLTPRAESIRIPLKRWLNDFDRNILVNEPFDPSTSERTFYIATSDLVEQMIAPRLVEELKALAPGIHLVFNKFDKRSFATEIESGDADFCITVLESTHPALMVTTLFRDDFVSVARAGHPIFAATPDAKAFCAYPHILAGTGRDIRGTVDGELEKLGLSRDVRYKVANFSSAPYLAESSDGIFTAPRRFVDTVLDKFNIVAFELPVDHPGYGMKVYWHVKNKDDQANRWLRERIFAVSNAERGSGQG